jgi:hypothetical protein
MSPIYFVDPGLEPSTDGGGRKLQKKLSLTPGTKKIGVSASVPCRR